MATIIKKTATGSAPKTKGAAKPKTAANPKTKPKTNTTAKIADAKGKILNTNSKVKNDMKNFKDKASDGARNAAERGKEKASQAVSGLGKLLRDSASAIDDSVGKNYGDYARTAADSVDGFAEKMSAKDVDDIATDARNFVRKSPAVAIGAAAAIGFVLARLIRSGRDET